MPYSDTPRVPVATPSGYDHLPPYTSLAPGSVPPTLAPAPAPTPPPRPVQEWKPRSILIVVAIIFAVVRAVTWMSATPVSMPTNLFTGIETRQPREVTADTFRVVVPAGWTVDANRTLQTPLRITSDGEALVVKTYRTTATTCAAELATRVGTGQSKTRPWESLDGAATTGVWMSGPSGDQYVACAVHKDWVYVLVDTGASSGATLDVIMRSWTWIG